MLNKEPVMLNKSDIEVEGNELEFDTMTFWADTFRHADLLQYQDDDVQMMITNNPETTTFELTLDVSEVPEYLSEFWKTGERFSISVDNEYFDLAVDNARVERLKDKSVTIVAQVLRKGFAHVC